LYTNQTSYNCVTPYEHGCQMAGDKKGNGKGGNGNGNGDEGGEQQ
jgi:hypothetical protein